VHSIKRLLRSNKDTDADWDNFKASMPATNDAEEFVTEHPEEFFVPFEQEFKTLHLRLHVSYV
jgi:hypothetical protein